MKLKLKLTRTLTLLGVALIGMSVAIGQVTKPFPAHWGMPPQIQAQDFGDLPEGYGKGSSTLAKWITANLEKDKLASKAGSKGPKPLYAINFEKEAEDTVPEGFIVLDGLFKVRAEGGNKFLELPGAPLDTFGVLFGPTEKENVGVTARVNGTGKGRRSPAIAVGLGGVGGYKLQISPSKKSLELFKSDEAVATVPFEWQSGLWTMMRLQVRKVKDGEWKIEGKAWPQAAKEPAGWQIIFEEKETPITGRASVWGNPYSGTPIQFDDFLVTTVK